MIESIDKNSWTKLLNRRVQHYGYEFKYGTNNVDGDQKLGQMPDFCDGISKPIQNVLKRFKIEKWTEA